MSAYVPVTYELTVEVTFPEPEGTSTSLLNAFSIVKINIINN